MDQLRWSGASGPVPQATDVSSSPAELQRGRGLQWVTPGTRRYFVHPVPLIVTHTKVNETKLSASVPKQDQTRQDKTNQDQNVHEVNKKAILIGPQNIGRFSVPTSFSSDKDTGNALTNEDMNEFYSSFDCWRCLLWKAGRVLFVCLLLQTEKVHLIFVHVLCCPIQMAFGCCCCCCCCFTSCVLIFCEKIFSLKSAGYFDTFSVYDFTAFFFFFFFFFVFRYCPVHYNCFFGAEISYKYCVNVHWCDCSASLVFVRVFLR